MNVTETVKHLIIINIIFFIGTYLLGDVAYQYLSLYYPENAKFQLWQPITHMFMHGGLMHIFFNMFALFSFGSVLEQFWGSKKFLFFYISCGLGAALLQVTVNYFTFHESIAVLVDNGFAKSDIIATLNHQGKLSPDWIPFLTPNGIENIKMSFGAPMVGASGAIYGLLIAFAFMFPNAELMMMFIPIPIKAKYFVPGIIAIDLYSGFSGNSIFGGGSNVAHFAHIGGAITGFIMMWYWKKNQFNNKRWN